MTNSNANPYQMGFDDAISGRPATFVGNTDDRSQYTLGYSAGGEEYFYQKGAGDGAKRHWDPPKGQTAGKPIFEAYKAGYNATKGNRNAEGAANPAFNQPFTTADKYPSRQAENPFSRQGPPPQPGTNSVFHRRQDTRQTRPSQGQRYPGNTSGFTSQPMANGRRQPIRSETTSLRTSGRQKQRNGLADILFYIGDAARLVKQSEAWAESLPESRGTLFAYAAATATMAMATFGLATVFDLFPSLDFAWYLGRWFQANVFSSYDWLHNLPMEQTIVLIVFAIAASPSLLEFFGSRLAQLNISVSLALRGAVLFDAFTDAPSAYRLAEAIARYIPFGEFVPANAAAILTKATAIGLSIPVLLAATLLIEILFVSFGSACWKVLDRIRTMPRVKRSPITNDNIPPRRI